MTAEQWELLRDAMHEKSLLLMRHEGKNFAKTGLDPSNYQEIRVANRTFWAISTPSFNAVIEEVLTKATERFPEKFGTGRAEDVLEAIYHTRPFGKLENFATFLGDEQFCYVFDIVDDRVNERVLRIDLFRRIKSLPSGGAEFVGGAFHAFCHYSYNGVPLSTERDLNDIHPRFLIYQLTRAFFVDPGEQIDEYSYNVLAPYDAGHEMKFAFYFEPCTRVYFVKTCHKKRKKR